MVIAHPTLNPIWGLFHQVGRMAQSAAPNFREAFCGVKLWRRHRAQMDRALSMKNAQL